MATSYPKQGEGVNAHPAINVTPVISAMAALDFTGNLAPHSWYQQACLRFESGKTNLVAITLLADIVYWYRPAVVRDETTGHILSATKRFFYDKLHWVHEQRAKAFGLSKRQVQDGISFLKNAGLITVEMRERVELPSGAVLYNQIFIEPVVEAIQRLTGLATEKAQATPPPAPQPAPAAPAPTPSPEQTPSGGYHATTGYPSRCNEAPPTPEREPYTKSSTQISTEKNKRSTLEKDNKYNDLGKADPHRELLPELVSQIIDLCDDEKSKRRYQQLHAACERYGLMSLWSKTLDSLKIRIKKGEKDETQKLDNPGSYFNKTLTLLLEGRGIPLPAGTKEERADIQAQIAASLAGAAGGAN